MKEEFSFETFKPVITFGRNQSGTYIQGYLNQSRNVMYAIKSVSLNKPNTDALLRRLQSENLCLKYLHSTEEESEDQSDRLQYYSSYIVGYHGIFENSRAFDIQPKPLYLCLEAVMGGNLFQYYYHHNQDLDFFDFQRIRIYSTQLINVLIFLYWKGVIHRDIKLSNIVLNSYGHIKLIDFDLAKVLVNDSNLSGRAHTICGTGHVLAPEVIAFGGRFQDQDQAVGYDYAVDWWSLGHAIYEMIMKTVPIPFQWNVGFSESLPDRVLPMDSLSSSYRTTAQYVIEQSRREESYQPYDEHWNFLSVSKLKQLLSRYQTNSERVSSGHDFSSYVPLQACFQEEIISLITMTEDFLSLLLTVAPEKRFGIGCLNHSLNSMKGTSRREKVRNLLSHESLQQSCFHPFLISEIAYPNDIRDKATISDYRHFLEREYRFPINEKISYFEMFPFFHEAKRVDAEMSNLSNIPDKKDSDQLTEAEQALFRDF